MRESGLNPEAKAATSSARGLFQFVEQTGLGLIKDYGAKYGLGDFSDTITRDSNGHCRVATSADRQAILALRRDPQLSAYMEGELAQCTRSNLEADLGRNVCDGEVYAAHFLGPDAACRLIQMNSASPDANAAVAFPQAAHANRSVFYHADGTPRTAREVYDWALRQPKASPNLLAGLKSAPVKPEHVNFVSGSAGIQDDNTNAVIASLSSWTPSRGFFASDAGTGAGQAPISPFLLTSGVMDVLAKVQTKH
jgi:hypothetical protein